MNRKEPFNDAALGKEDARKQQIVEWERERDRALEQLRDEQRRRHDEDMEKARQQVLREHNRLDCRPDYARRKALTSAQLEERARGVVETQNLRESNVIRNAHRERVAAFENQIARPASENRERSASPKTIRTIFNGLPKARDGREHERDRLL